MSRFFAIAAIILLGLALTTTTPGATLAQQPTPPLAVIVHPATAVTNLNRNRIAALFSMTQQRWGDGRKVVPLNYSARHPVRVTFDRAVLGMDPDEVARFWIDRRVRGQGTAPRTVSSPKLMARVVAKLPGAIGYVPVADNVAGAKEVARIVDGRVVAPGGGR